MSIRVGFIVGKEFDFVNDSVVDTTFLNDLPAHLAARPAPRFTWPGMSAPPPDQVSADMAIAWAVHKRYPQIKVDFISGEDITLSRLQSNLCNFIIGYDILDAMCEGAARLAVVTDAFKNCGNIMPSWEVQEAIYMKSGYMNEAARLGVPMAPTIFAHKSSREPQALLQEIQARGWQHFVMKQSYGFGSAGFKKLSVKDCQDKPEILEEYFAEHSECPEYVVQEFIEGFCRNWEVRCFWFNGEFLYAIANRAAVSQLDGEKVGVIPQEEIPSEFLENAKRIGKQALESLPQLTTPDGQPIGMTLIRTDVGCADSKVWDKDTHWDPDAKTFFLNEIEYGGTTYFPRVLKFDAIPMYADLYAAKALEIHEKMSASKNKNASNSDGCFSFLKAALERFAGFFDNSHLVQASGLLGSVKDSDAGFASSEKLKEKSDQSDTEETESTCTSSLHHKSDESDSESACGSLKSE